MGDDVAVKYLASDKPFQTRLGSERRGEGTAEWAVEPVVEVLCDTIWGVDGMVGGDVLLFVWVSCCAVLLLCCCIALPCYCVV